MVKDKIINRFVGLVETHGQKDFTKIYETESGIFYITKGGTEKLQNVKETKKGVFIYG